MIMAMHPKVERGYNSSASPSIDFKHLESEERNTVEFLLTFVWCVSLFWTEDVPLPVPYNPPRSVSTQSFNQLGFSLLLPMLAFKSYLQIITPYSKTNWTNVISALKINSVQFLFIVHEAQRYCTTFTIPNFPIIHTNFHPIFIQSPVIQLFKGEVQLHGINSPSSRCTCWLHCSIKFIEKIHLMLHHTALWINESWKSDCILRMRLLGLHVSTNVVRLRESRNSGLAVFSPLTIMIRYGLPDGVVASFPRMSSKSSLVRFPCHAPIFSLWLSTFLHIS